MTCSNVLDCIVKSGLVACFVTGCGSGRPEPQGRLSRPDILVYRQGVSEQQGDLFILDAEAGGVRTLKYSTTSDGIVTRRFVPAPLVFFPSTIATPGWPVAMALSKDQEQGRLYVLSAQPNTIHVLDVPKQSCGAPCFIDATAQNQRVVARIAVDDLAIDQCTAIPSELLVISSSSVTDTLALGLDCLDQESSRVVIAKVDLLTDEPSVIDVQGTSLASGLSSMVHREDESFLLAQYAGSVQFDAIRLDAETGSVQGVQTVDAGGVLYGLSNSKTTALGVRRAEGLIDVLVQDAGSYRVDRTLSFPGAAQIATTAFGSFSQFSVLVDAEVRHLATDPDLGVEKTTDILYTVAVDGRVQLAYGDPLSVLTSSTGEAVRIDLESEDAVSGQTVFLPAVPSDSAFVPVRNGFITSVPGSSSLVELRAAENRLVVFNTR